MQAPAQALVAFFEQVAQRNEVQLDKLRREPRFAVRPECWCFTLPDLHAFLQRQDAVFRSVDYTQFRKALFGSPINRAIAPYGAEITIADNRGKVDQSSYALVWTKHEG
mgnify:CR=1 FL=1